MKDTEIKTFLRLQNEKSDNNDETLDKLLQNLRRYIIRQRFNS